MEKNHKIIPVQPNVEKKSCSIVHSFQLNVPEEVENVPP